MASVHPLHFPKRHQTRKGQQRPPFGWRAEEDAVNTLVYDEEGAEDERSTVCFVDVVVVDAEVEPSQKNRKQNRGRRVFLNLRCSLRDA